SAGGPALRSRRGLCRPAVDVNASSRAGFRPTSASLRRTLRRPGGERPKLRAARTLAVVELGPRIEQFREPRVAALYDLEDLRGGRRRVVVQVGDQALDEQV